MKKRRQEKHICAYCGKEFFARKGAIYCSASCRNTAGMIRRELEEGQKKALEGQKKPIGAIITPKPIEAAQPQTGISKDDILRYLLVSGVFYALDKMIRRRNKSKRTR